MRSCDSLAKLDVSDAGADLDAPRLAAPHQTRHEEVDRRDDRLRSGRIVAERRVHRERAGDELGEIAQRRTNLVRHGEMRHVKAPLKEPLPSAQVTELGDQRNEHEGRRTWRDRSCRLGAAIIRVMRAVQRSTRARQTLTCPKMRSASAMSPRQ